MFVVMAVVTTVATTPLTTFLYPDWYQIKVDRWRRGEIDWDGKPSSPVSDNQMTSAPLADEFGPVQNLIIYLRLDELKGLCTLAALLGPNKVRSPPSPRIHPSKIETSNPPEELEQGAVTDGQLEKTPALRIHGIHLLELTDRDSTIMKVSESAWNTVPDPVIDIFCAFARWHDLVVTTSVSVVPEDLYAETIVSLTSIRKPDLLLIPLGQIGTIFERTSDTSNGTSGFKGPFPALVSNIMNSFHGNVGIFIEQRSYATLPGKESRRPSASQMSVSGSACGLQKQSPHSQHIIFPFFGGPDDRFALRFILQLSQNDQVTATIIHMNISSSIEETFSNTGNSSAEDQVSDEIFFSTFRDSLPGALSERVIFRQLYVESVDGIKDPVSFAVATVRDELRQTAQCKANNLIVVGRRNKKLSPGEDAGTLTYEETRRETKQTRRVLGVVGEAIVRSDGEVRGDMLVLQSTRDNL